MAPVVRPSLLGTARRSMLAYKTRRDAPYEPTPAMNWGSLVDAFLFDTGTERFRVFEGDRRTKEWKAFKEAQSGKVIFTPEEWNTAYDCAAALKKHPAVKRVLASGEAQFAIQWTDEETGLQMAGRPDFLSSSEPGVWDLKTTSGGLNDRSLGNTIDKWGYGIQMAAYRMGLRANGIDLNPGFIFVDSEPPYDCRVVMLVPDQVDEFEREARGLLRRIAECERTGIWPGVSQQISTLSLPHYFFAPQIDASEAA